MLEEIWQGVAEDSHLVRPGLTGGPYLRVAYWTETGDHGLSADRTFFVEPAGPEQSAGLERAARVTLEILVRVYGDRLAQEVRAAGLEVFLPGRSLAEIRHEAH